MRRLVLLTLLVLAGVGSAHAGPRFCKPEDTGPCYPGESAEKALDDRLRKIMDEYRDYDKQRRLEEKDREAAIKDKKSLEKLGVWERDYVGLDEKEKKIAGELTDYMEDVAKAYRLPTQIGDKRDITVGAFKGVTMMFGPKVIFDDIYIKTKPDPRNPNKTLTYARDYGGDTAAASTIANGDIVIRAGSFEWRGRAKAGIVASYLYHESVHYRHMTTESGVYKKEWSEALAYTAVTNFQDSVFMLEEDFKRHNEQQAAKNRSKLAADKTAKEQWKQNGGLLRGQKIPASEPDLLTDAIQDDDDWRAMAAYAKTLGEVPDKIKEGRRQLEERVRRERQEIGDFERRADEEWRRRIGLPPSPPPGGSAPSGGPSGCATGGPGRLPVPCLPSQVQRRYPAPPPPQVQPAVPAQPAQPAQAWTPTYALNKLAEKGCADPWGLSQADLDLHWSLLMSHDERGVVVQGLQGCQDRLYRGLRDMVAQGNPRRLTQEIFARTAEAARNPAPAQTTDEFPDIPGRQSPDIPTCRYHDWCKAHPLNKR